MTLSVNAALYEADSPEQGELQVVVKTSAIEDSLIRVLSELSHDLRQPLTSLNMNLQCAVKMLQSATPQIAGALEALADCLSTERDMVELLAQAKRRAATFSTNAPAMPLNDFARDLLLTARTLEPGWRLRVHERLTTPTPYVSSGFVQLRVALLSILRRSLILDESEPGSAEGVVIETRSIDDRVELRFTGLPQSLATLHSFQSLHMLITSLVRHVHGHAHFAVHDDCVTFVISAPAAPASTLHLPGARHGV